MTAGNAQLEAPAPGTPLLAARLIAEGEAREIVLGSGVRRFAVILLRHQGRLSAFLNRCPHRGTPLNALPERFFTRDGRLLLCATHGARFRPSDGLCVAGPCLGRALAPIRIEVRDGLVRLASTRPGTSRNPG